MELSAVYTDNGATVELTAEAREYTRKRIVTCSSRMLVQLSALEAAAATEAGVLIFGAPGTPKEQYAEHVHALSARRQEVYLRFDCGATPAYRCEEILFGAWREDGRGRRGMLETAAGGTLLLDEVCALPSFLYERMERFLESGVIMRRKSRERVPVDVRLVAACSRDPAAVMRDHVETAAFLQKLAPIHICITPLRERPEDIALLTLYYLERANLRNETQKKMGSGLFREILAYPWPGNERELKSFVEQMVMTTQEDVLSDPDTLRSMEQLCISVPAQTAAEDDEAETKSLKEMVSEYELLLIRQSIRKHGSLRKAAKALQIAPSALSRKLSAAEKNETEL